MLPVADRLLVAHTAAAAVAAGASRLVIVVGYEATDVRTYFDESFDAVPVTFAEQPGQRGTANAVRAAASALDDGPFAVLNGYALYDHDSLSELYASTPAVGSFEVDNPSAYGVLHTEATGSTTRATGVMEKPADPPPNLISARVCLPRVPRRTGWRSKIMIVGNWS